MPNRLAKETSPYLLQHAENPVDWYPWGNEAFEEARRRGVPVLLSVGYSSCHWCHVMERESFENDHIAAMMNDGFVSIKVDREERPDVDSVYMTAVQAMTGQGGWPMTVFMTADGEPFYGGTYFPPDDRGGMPAFPRVLQAITDAFTNRRLKSCPADGSSPNASARRSPPPKQMLSRSRTAFSKPPSADSEASSTTAPAASDYSPSSPSPLPWSSCSDTTPAPAPRTPWRWSS